MGGGVKDGAAVEDAATADASSDAAADSTTEASLPDASTDATPDATCADGALLDASLAHFCELPGSRRYTASGVVVVPGGASSPDLSFLTLPTGYCVHYYGSVGNARQVRVAPGSELFVASPTTSTTGGGPGGLAAIAVLPDDNGDGVADAVSTFAGSLPSTQGLAFAPGWFYYQSGTQILRVPYATGDRTPSGPFQVMANFTAYESALHWPKAIDVADDGTVYFGNGSDQGEVCDTSRPFHGGVLSTSDGGVPIARGLRNPIALRCARGHDQCFALELALDYTAGQGGREKMVRVHSGDDWGFSCCATANLPYSMVSPVPDCSGVTQETVSFVVGETPFGLDFAPSSWPSGVAGSAFLAFHGAAGSWKGARLATVAMDPATGLPAPSSDLSGVDTGGLAEFASGWDDGTLAHGRPAAVTFSADGRLFVANDSNGVIFWIAPLGS